MTGVGDKTSFTDQLGNPLYYLGHGLTWEKGRQLKSFDDVTFTYNANGIRTSKTANGVKCTYTLDGTKILRYDAPYVTEPIYDNEDDVCGLRMVGHSYFFQKNLQGDVIGITDWNGNVLVRYSYDAWGVCTIVEDTSGFNLGNINPFRYRSYFYDPETGLYYLQSRYYDPQTGRFINADEVEIATLKGKTSYTNLFVYCENNVVNQCDIYGNLGISSLLSVISDALSLIVSIGTTAVFDSKPYKQLSTQIKNAKSRKARKELVKAQKKLLKNGIGKGLYRVTKIIGYIIFFAPFVQYVVQWKNDSMLFVEFIVTIIVDIISTILCEMTSWLIGLIPFAGVILGFAGAWIIGKLLDKHYTDRRIANIAAYYNKQLPKLTTFKKWIESFGYALTI